MQLTIVIRQEIPDEPQAKSLLDSIKQRLVDFPEIKINASINQTIDTE